jgi:hypothetical protein
MRVDQTNLARVGNYLAQHLELNEKAQFGPR